MNTLVSISLFFVSLALFIFGIILFVVIVGVVKELLEDSEMNCDHFDPITSSVAPCCAVCSHRGACEKKKAAPVLEHRDGKAEQINARSASIVHEN